MLIMVIYITAFILKICVDKAAILHNWGKIYILFCIQTCAVRAKYIYETIWPLLQRYVSTPFFKFIKFKKKLVFNVNKHNGFHICELYKTNSRKRNNLNTWTILLETNESKCSFVNKYFHFLIVAEGLIKNFLVKISCQGRCWLYCNK